jgi:hypothetical protein
VRVVVAVLAAALGVASATVAGGCGEKRTTGTATARSHTPTTP